MSQTLLLVLLAIGLLVGFVVYPRLMWQLVGAVLSGLLHLLVDALGLLLAWI